MNKKTLERANKLERQIKSLKGLLKGDCMLLWRGFAIHYVVNFGPSQGNDVYHDISSSLDYDEEDEINDKLKGILKDVLIKKEKELKAL